MTKTARSSCVSLFLALLSLAILQFKPAATFGQSHSQLSPNASGIPATNDDLTLTASKKPAASVALYEVYEIVLAAQNAGANPYVDGPAVSVTFTGASGAALGKAITVKGFWDGESAYRVRFAPTALGNWAWTSVSTDAGLNGKSGTLTCSGTLPAKHASAHGHVHESTQFPYTFAHADSTPFFMMGDTQWLFSTGVVSWPAEFQAYIDARAAQGFNYVHGMIYSIYPDDTDQNEGGQAFDSNQVDRLNPGYWQAVDKRIAYMNEKGIVAGLVLAWANEGWQNFSTPAQVDRYLQYIISRYAAYNIIWITAGEYEEDDPPGGHDHVGEFLRANDPYHHPITTHTVETSADDFGNAPWHTTIYQQTNKPELITQDRKYNKPVINAEFGYEGDQSAEEVRQDAWAIVMRGGFCVYGDTNTFHYNAVMTPEKLYSPGAAFMTILKNFWTNNGKYAINWWKFTRFDSLGNFRWLAGRPGVEYVLYTDNPNPFSVDLSTLSGEVFGQWFDTKSGQWSLTFSGAASAAFILNPPSAGFAAYITVPKIDRLLLGGGDMQIGRPGAMLASPLVVKVTNSVGLAMRDVRIEFQVISGGGQLVKKGICDSARCVVATGADGTAIINWRLGVTGAQKVEARVVERQDLAVRFMAILDDTSSLPDPSDPLPSAFMLRHHPNPFRDFTRFEIALPAPGRISLKIFNLQGGEVITLMQGAKPAGRFFLTWEGKDETNGKVASGIYFAVLDYKSENGPNGSQRVRQQQRVVYVK